MTFQVTKSESAGVGLINVRPGKVLADDLKSLVDAENLALDLVYSTQKDVIVLADGKPVSRYTEQGLAWKPSSSLGGWTIQ